MSDAEKKTEPSLAQVAALFEEELARFEDLAAGLGRLDVNSDKTLQRARQGLEACAACEQGLATNLGAFVQAMQAFQDRQQRCMASVLESAKHIEQRYKARQALLERVTQLGRQASGVTAPMEQLAESGADAAKVLGSMEDIGKRLDAVIAEASELASAAAKDEWQDIARDVDTLKQQLQAARNKVLLTQRSVASRAPS
jgi:hypothetical protein